MRGRQGAQGFFSIIINTKKRNYNYIAAFIFTFCLFEWVDTSETRQTSIFNGVY